MRRIVIALVAGAFVFSVFGCSSKAAETSPAATPAPAAATAPAAVPVAVAGAAAPSPSLSDTQTAVFTAFPTGADIPPDLTQKITVDKQPTLIFFFDSNQYTSREVRKIIDTVRSANRGLVDLVAYDIGKYTVVSADGEITVDPKLANNEVAKQAVLFARNPAIDVTFTPFIVLTDGQGYIIYKHRGLVDPVFLEREVQRAIR